MKIFRTKNGIVITPYEHGQSVILERMTSSYDAVYHKRIELAGFYINRYFEKPAFVTYYQHLDFLRDQFPEYEIIDVDVIQPERIDPFEMKEDFALRPVQESIIRDILASAKKTREWFIHLQTGQGKTVLGTVLVQLMQMKTFIFCFSRGILDQWKKCFADKTQCNVKRIKILDSSSEIRKFLNGKLDPDNYDVYMATSSLIASFLKSGAEKLTEFMELLGIGVAIFDEAHRTLASTIKISALCNFRYSLYLSADFAQSDQKKEALFYRFFQKCRVLHPTDEEEASLRYTDIIVADYNTHPSKTDELSIRNRYGFDRNRYMQYQFKKEKIYDVIYKILDTVYGAEGTDAYRTLILFSNIEHVNLMTAALKERYMGKKIIGRFHGECSEEEKKETIASANIIVSTYASFGTGRDVEKFKYVIGTNQSDKVEDNQAAGRARPLPDNSHVKYFMVVDTGFSYCVRKLRQRLNYLMQTKAARPPLRWKVLE